MLLYAIICPRKRCFIIVVTSKIGCSYSWGCLALGPLLHTICIQLLVLLFNLLLSITRHILLYLKKYIALKEIEFYLVLKKFLIISNSKINIKIFGCYSDLITLLKIYVYKQNRIVRKNSECR